MGQQAGKGAGAAASGYNPPWGSTPGSINAYLQQNPGMPGMTGGNMGRGPMGDPQRPTRTEAFLPGKSWSGGMDASPGGPTPSRSGERWGNMQGAGKPDPYQKNLQGAMMDPTQQADYQKRLQQAMMASGGGFGGPGGMMDTAVYNRGGMSPSSYQTTNVYRGAR